MKNLMSYYDTKLLTEISTVTQGLLLTLSIPLASRQAKFTVYLAHIIPMPHPQPSEALQWVTEGPSLAISQDSMETTTLTQQQLDNCVGSSTYRICHETMETHLGQSSCLATLYYKEPIVALEVCETRKILLPIPEKATNLGYGIWLITSTRQFKGSQHMVSGTTSTSNVNGNGCNVCIITLNCGELISKHIKIRSDLSSCSKIPETQINVKLDDALQHLIPTVPNLEKLPYFKSKMDANIALFQQMKLELTTMSVDNLQQSDYDKTAAPLVHQMPIFKPTLIEKLDFYVPKQTSLTLTISVFIGNLLHILVMYLYHKLQFIRNLTPNFMKSPKTKFPMKQVVSVTKDQFPMVQSMDHKLKRKTTFINESSYDIEVVSILDEINQNISWITMKISDLEEYQREQEKKQTQTESIPRSHHASQNLNCSQSRNSLQSQPRQYDASDTRQTTYVASQSAFPFQLQKQKQNNFNPAT